MKKTENFSIILFDGICNLCSKSVQYIIQHDPKHIFRFASLQSSVAKKILSGHNLPLKNGDSIILFKNHKIYTQSTAALLVAKNLKGVTQLLYAFVIVPKFIRDAVYRIIAKNRYKWFGKKENCWLPSPELQNLFLD